LYTGIAVAFLASLGYFLSFQRRGKLAVHIVVLMAAIPLLALASALTKPPRDANVLYEKTNSYHRIRVVEEDFPSGVKVTALMLDSTIEGVLFNESPTTLLKYQRYWELAKLFSGKLENILVLGGGAFTLPQALVNHNPGSRLEVVEIDPAVVEVGRLFFQVDQYPKMRIVVDDARRYLKHTNRKYDLIFGDAFQGVHSVPAHLLTKEFFQEIKNRLNERGIFIINIISAVKGKHTTLFLSVINTLKQVFPNTYVFAVKPQKQTSSAENILIFATNFDLNIDSIKSALPPEKRSLKKLLDTLVPPSEYNPQDGYLLTDRFNPVEYLVAKTLPEVLRK